MQFPLKRLQVFRAVAREEAAPASYYLYRTLEAADFQALAKRSFDVLGSAFLILLFSPVMLAIMLAIKLDDNGPIFFRQERTGQFGKSFSIFKFRSMVTHNTPQNTLDYVGKRDPRITRVGHILRSTSLDELPQLFNVLLGDLSLVGPRPQPVYYLEHYGSKIRGYRDRLSVKPGATGPVQVSPLRAEIDTLEGIQKRVDLEMYYVNNQNLLLDIKICIFTAVMMLTRRVFNIAQ